MASARCNEIRNAIVAGNTITFLLLSKATTSFIYFKFKKKMLSLLQLLFTFYYVHDDIYYAFNLVEDILMCKSFIRKLIIMYTKIIQIPEGEF